mmetsp:Transcript_4345/g.13750  ORF Transcript_4345/g.13750 Transcript_4345/m.13750 type:complete len:260 (+) Transcript_4345:259-1038(+)
MGNVAASSSDHQPTYSSVKSFSKASVNASPSGVGCPTASSASTVRTHSCWFSDRVLLKTLPSKRHFSGSTVVGGKSGGPLGAKFLWRSLSPNPLPTGGDGDPKLLVAEPPPNAVPPPPPPKPKPPTAGAALPPNAAAPPPDPPEGDPPKPKPPVAAPPDVGDAAAPPPKLKPPLPDVGDAAAPPPKLKPPLPDVGGAPPKPPLNPAPTSAPPASQPPASATPKGIPPPPPPRQNLGSNPGADGAAGSRSPVRGDAQSTR